MNIFTINLKISNLKMSLDSLFEKYWYYFIGLIGINDQSCIMLCDTYILIKDVELISLL